MQLRLSKTTNYIVIVLILLLPVSKNYKLLLFGERTEGIAIHHRRISSRSVEYSGYSTYTRIRFETENSSIVMNGPENIIYNLGEKVQVIYDKKDPTKCIIPSFAYLYTGSSAILPGILLILWMAFYLAVKPPTPKSFVKH